MRHFLAGLAVLASSAPVLAGPVASMPSTNSNRPVTDQQLLVIYQGKMKPLRDEILARKAAEGGTLSEASRAEFQLRLDTINKDFRRFVKKQDVYAYDAWGDRDG